MFNNIISSGAYLGLLAMLGWGFSDFIAALVSRKAGSYLSFFWVMVWSFLVLICYFFFTGQRASLDLNIIVLSGLAGLLHAGAGLSFYKSLEIGKVSLVSPIASAWSVITVLGGVIFFHEEFQKGYILPLILIIFGTLLVATNPKEIFSSWKSLFSDKGIPYAVLAMFGYGFGFLILNQAIKINGWLIPNLLLFAVVSCVMGLVLFATKTLVFSESQKGFWMQTMAAGLLWAIAYIGYSIGIESFSASIIAPLGAAFPAVTIVLATIFLKEKVKSWHAVGIISILLGVAMLST
ncbi:MAG: DMT family transporter [bacterium]|nr:DMT family transporter [bacterium]